ncbi:CitMHS family transporter [Flavisphingomonas formosensis]|uniref:CitMHS family transporter n=1 Tax=Flavisphingomonas formosensis TaxID=861534 RepID=UPI0012F82F90|nr:citrate:proton symporter [Sphingomonas formosensis]
MLAVTGGLAIMSLLAAIISKRVAPLAALIAVPVIAALLAGFGLETSDFIIAGIGRIAPVAGMFVFAILFFGIMSDAGLLDPIVLRVLKVVGRRPTRIVVGTALLALLIHLDGSGAVCFLITIPAMLPLYDRLHMDRRVLACAAAMGAGVNFLPWSGVTLRASAVLGLPPTGIVTGRMLLVQAVGICFVMGAAWWLGHREGRRLLAAGNTASDGDDRDRACEDADQSLRRPHLFWANLAITVVVMATLISGAVDPVVMFMIGTVVALLLNYPDAEAQRARIDAHARAALLMASILFAAGAFTGIMTESGMIGALAKSVVGFVPTDFGSRIPLGLAVIAMPLSLLFDPDSFYFGVLPVVADVAQHFDVPKVQVAQAALLGQMTTGFPVSPLTPSTFLLAGLCRVDLGSHQRFSIPWLFGTSIVMTLAAAALNVFPL